MCWKLLKLMFGTFPQECFYGILANPKIVTCCSTQTYVLQSFYEIIKMVIMLMGGSISPPLFKTGFNGS